LNKIPSRSHQLSERVKAKGLKSEAQFYADGGGKRDVASGCGGAKTGIR